MRGTPLAQLGRDDVHRAAIHLSSQPPFLRQDKQHIVETDQSVAPIWRWLEPPGNRIAPKNAAGAELAELPERAVVRPSLRRKALDSVGGREQANRDRRGLER